LTAESHDAWATLAKDLYTAAPSKTTAAGFLVLTPDTDSAIPADLAAETQAARATLAKDLYNSGPPKTTAAGSLVQPSDADSAVSAYLDAESHALHGLSAQLSTAKTDLFAAEEKEMEEILDTPGRPINKLIVLLLSSQEPDDSEDVLAL
jgi:hypothetical protein